MEWLPDVCSQLHREMISIYWMMILPLIVFLVILEMFKTKGTEPDAGKILTRALASILMLISFKETINLVAFVGDGVVSGQLISDIFLICRQLKTDRLLV